MVLTEAVFEFSENLCSARSLFMRFARFESIIFRAVLMPVREIPSGPVALLGFKDFIIRFISAALFFGKSNMEVLFCMTLIFKIFE